VTLIWNGRAGGGAGVVEGIVVVERELGVGSTSAVAATETLVHY